MGVGAILSGVGSLLGVGSSLMANAQNQQNFERQMDFAKYQYEDTKKWNSMPEQVKRLRAAGLNPALALSPLGAGTQSSVSQPSAIPQQPLDLSGLSQFANGMALNDSQRDKTQAEIELTHLKSIQQDWENFISQMFSVSEHSKNLELLSNKVSESLNHSLLLAAQGDYTKALEQLAHAQEFAEYAKGGKDHQQMENLKEEFQWISVKARAYINHLKHQNSALDAGAALSLSSAKLNTLDYDIKSDPDVKAALGQTFIETLNKLQVSNKVGKEELRRAKSLADIAEKDNDVYYWVLVYDELLKGGATVADLLTLKKKINALSGLSNAAERNAETRSGRLAHDKDMDINTYTEENTYQFKNGRPNLKSAVRKGRKRK